MKPEHNTAPLAQTVFAHTRNFETIVRNFLGALATLDQNAKLKAEIWRQKRSPFLSLSRALLEYSMVHTEKMTKARRQHLIAIASLLSGEDSDEILTLLVSTIEKFEFEHRMLRDSKKHTDETRVHLPDDVSDILRNSAAVFQFIFPSLTGALDEEAHIQLADQVRMALVDMAGGKDFDVVEAKLNKKVKDHKKVEMYQAAAKGLQRLDWEKLPPQVQGLLNEAEYREKFTYAMRTTKAYWKAIASTAYEETCKRHCARHSPKVVGYVSVKQLVSQHLAMNKGKKRKALMAAFAENEIFAVREDIVAVCVQFFDGFDLKQPHEDLVAAIGELKSGAAALSSSNMINAAEVARRYCEQRKVDGSARYEELLNAMVEAGLLLIDKKQIDLFFNFLDAMLKRSDKFDLQRLRNGLGYFLRDDYAPQGMASVRQLVSDDGGRVDHAQLLKLLANDFYFIRSEQAGVMQAQLKSGDGGIYKNIKRGSLSTKECLSPRVELRDYWRRHDIKSPKKQDVIDCLQQHGIYFLEYEQAIMLLKFLDGFFGGGKERSVDDLQANISLFLTGRYAAPGFVSIHKLVSLYLVRQGYYHDLVIDNIADAFVQMHWYFIAEDQQDLMIEAVQVACQSLLARQISIYDPKWHVCFCDLMKVLLGHPSQFNADQLRLRIENFRIMMEEPRKFVQVTQIINQFTMLNDETSLTRDALLRLFRRAGVIYIRAELQQAVAQILSACAADEGFDTELFVHKLEQFRLGSYDGELPAIYITLDDAAKRLVAVSGVSDEAQVGRLVKAWLASGHHLFTKEYIKRLISYVEAKRNTEESFVDHVQQCMHHYSVIEPEGEHAPGSRRKRSASRHGSKSSAVLFSVDEDDASPVPTLQLSKQEHKKQLKFAGGTSQRNLRSPRGTDIYQERKRTPRDDDKKRDRIGSLRDLGTFFGFKNKDHIDQGLESADKKPYGFANRSSSDE